MTNPNAPAFKWYGGRGIKICDEWLDFATFYNYVSKLEQGQMMTFAEAAEKSGVPYNILFARIKK